MGTNKLSFFFCPQTYSPPSHHSHAPAIAVSMYAELLNNVKFAYNTGSTVPPSSFAEFANFDGIRAAYIIGTYEYDASGVHTFHVYSNQIGEDIIAIKR